MNLCIDQGNTKTKIAIFEEDEPIYNTVINDIDFDAWEELFTIYKIKNTIISSVKDFDSKLISFLKFKSEKFIELTHLTPLPITNLYETPETLGKDRLAAVIGAFTLQPQTNCLIIDAGTAITFDFIDSDGVYHGGTIAPGLQMRFKALNSFTQKLPLVPVSEHHPILGKNTYEAISSGVINGMLFEIDGYINLLKEKHPDLSIFLTGGDSFFFDNKVKNSIFANQNLVSIGLNRIINHNA